MHVSPRERRMGTRRKTMGGKRDDDDDDAGREEIIALLCLYNLSQKGEKLLLCRSRNDSKLWRAKIRFFLDSCYLTCVVNYIL
jgi:hypothetical protein